MNAEQHDNKPWGVKKTKKKAVVNVFFLPYLAG